MSFADEGFVVVRGLVPADLVEATARAEAALRAAPEAASLLHPSNLRCRFKLEPASGRQLLDAIDPVIDLLPPARAIAELPALLHALQELFGERPRLFKDKLILKSPGAPGYPLHQDFIAWPFFPESFTTVMIAIDPSGAANGCLELVPGSHHRGYLSPRDGDFHDLPDHPYPAAARAVLELAPGDAVIFGCFAVHGSGPNDSAAPRRHLYLSYNKDSDGGDQRAAHYRYFHAWLSRRYAEYGAANGFFR